MGRTQTYPATAEDIALFNAECAVIRTLENAVWAPDFARRHPDIEAQY